MAGTPLEQLFGGGNPQTAQNFMTQRFLPGGGGMQSSQPGMGSPSPFGSPLHMSPGMRLADGVEGGGMMVGPQMGGQPQSQPLGGDAPQNYLVGQRQQQQQQGSMRGADPYAPSPPPMLSGGNPVQNFLRGFAGRPVESSSDLAARNWQNQEQFKSAYREWQSQDAEWQLKMKAYQEGQATQRETGLTMRAVANEPGSGDPATDDFAQMRPWVKEIMKTNPNIDPMHIPVIMDSFKNFFTAEQKAKAEELKQQEKLTRDAETERHHNVQEEQTGQRISIARDRATAYIESNSEKMSQATEKLAAAQTKQEFDEAYKSAELTIRGIVDGARGPGATMSEDERATFQSGINSAISGFRTTLTEIKKGNLTPKPQGGGAPPTNDAGASDALLNEARVAIAQGADPAAVKKRLQEKNVDPSLLGP